MLDPKHVSVAVVGTGPAAARRVQQLRDGGLVDPAIFETPPDLSVLAGFQVVYVADLERSVAERIAMAVRQAGGLVNVEDVIDLCDFHVPGTVRRGDLLLTVGTGGNSPGLARRLRKYLEALFVPEWAERLGEIGAARRKWLDEGADLKTLAARTDEMIDRNGWL
ncbi:MAG: siroheme synthase [Proteobacteria bacterium]|nr:siroheme synthase [Pseudomonadota bacterium]